MIKPTKPCSCERKIDNFSYGKIIQVVTNFIIVHRGMKRRRALDKFVSFSFRIVSGEVEGCQPKIFDC